MIESSNSEGVECLVLNDLEEWFEAARYLTAAQKHKQRGLDNLIQDLVEIIDELKLEPEVCTHGAPAVCSTLTERDIVEGGN